MLIRLPLNRSLAWIKSVWAISVWLVFAIADPTRASGQPDTLPGVVVEGVEPNLLGANVGIRPGAVLLKWQCDDVEGVLDSPFEFSRVDRARGTCHRWIIIEGLISGARRRWRMGLQEWGVTVVPRFSDRLRVSYQEVIESRKNAGAASAAIRLQQLADIEEEPLKKTWLILRTAEFFGVAHDFAAADRAYGRAFELACMVTPLVKEKVLFAWGEALFERRAWEEAQRRYLDALVEAEKIEAVSEAQACLNALGSAALNPGDLANAESYFRRDLTINTRLGPSLSLAVNFAELAIVMIQQGKLADAETYFNRDIAITRKLAPGSEDLAKSYNGFGVLLRQRRDLFRAEAFFRKALVIMESRSPRSAGSATILSNLGLTLQLQGNTARAERCYRRALEIEKQQDPDSPAMATMYERLGSLEFERGDFSGADRQFSQALAIQERLVPGSLAHAETLNRIGRIESKRGNLNGALALQRRAVDITNALAPGSTIHAECLADVAEILYSQGALEDAALAYEQAIATLDDQVDHLGGGDDVRSDFRAQYASYYKQFVDLLVVQGRPKRALEVLERSRARLLLSTLKQGQVQISRGLDPLLLQKEQEVDHALTAKTNYRVRLLRGSKTDSQLETVDREIADLLVHLREIKEQIRGTSPEYWALTETEPVALDEIQAALGPDTVLVEYCVGERRSYVWTVGAERIDLQALAPRRVLYPLARRFYELLRDQNGGKTGQLARQQQFSRLQRQLSVLLLDPIAAQIAGKRIAVVGDGILQYIPFAALTLPAGPPGVRTRSPLIAGHEVVTLPSASVLIALRHSEASREQEKPLKTVGVFADPVFSAQDIRVTHGSDLRGMATHPPIEHRRSPASPSREGLRQRNADSLHLPRLLFSRREAELAVKELPRNEFMSALDFKASLSAVMSAQLSSFRIVHFATHAIVDNAYPELSGLVFSLVDKRGNPQNGLLILEDVYNLKLSADLVVLSACNTGIGKLVDNEGLVGLTRGFMYAGTPRVISSLWAVDDQATAKLMGAFYKFMRQPGQRLSAAAALRAAQLQMSKNPRWQDPFYWASFQLHGEWR
jgi:CHAT domain-containing protein/tetratricopeptide (TPR) repeat protein